MPQLRIGEHVVLYDDADAALVAAHAWSVSWKGRAWYVQSTSATDRVYLHRAILGLRPGDGVRVDHENGDTLDNRRANLRRSDASGNAQNVSTRRTDNRSGYKGVSWSAERRKWFAKITVHGRQIGLGRFDDPIEAARAYDAAARAHFGRFAQPNFPEEE